MRLTPVVAVIDAEWEEDIELAMDEDLAAMDDAYWLWQAWRRPFSWPLFARWWVARRWVMPRDVRKQ
jgi:hypothetical protein